LIDRRGVPTFQVRSCAGVTITNVAFHPERRQELDMTDSDSGHILVAQVPVSGHRLASHADAPIEP
jgi:gluconolactonase